MLGIPEELPDHVRTPAQARHWIATTYQANGFHVIPNPTEEDLPRELWNFHLDFLAERHHEHVAIVVRRRNDLSENTKALAEALEHTKDWVLELVILPVTVFATAPNPLPTASSLSK